VQERSREDDGRKTAKTRRRDAVVDEAEGTRRNGSGREVMLERSSGGVFVCDGFCFRRRIIEEERLRLLKEHAKNLIGYLPKGVLRADDLPYLGSDLVNAD
jgi:hypothetical protein